MTKLTCEDRRLDELNKLVYLDENVDSHLELGTVMLSAMSGFKHTRKIFSQDLEEVVSLLISLSKKAE